MFGFSSYQEFFYQTAIKKMQFPHYPPFQNILVIPLLRQNMRAAGVTTDNGDTLTWVAQDKVAPPGPPLPHMISCFCMGRQLYFILFYF
jgi:hypothetical protein